MRQIISKIINHITSNKVQRICILIILLNSALTTIVQRYKCVELSETELFLRIPKSYVWDFIECEK